MRPRSMDSGGPGGSRVVVALCFAVIVFDGYDLIVYGAVVPSLLQYEPWALDPQQAGAIGSYALIGMLIGALTAGFVTDLFGRRRIMLASIAWFSAAMGLCALSPNPEVFGLLRFLAGLGLGGVMPTAIALTIEYSPVHRRGLNNALMFSGYSVGGILAAVLALALVPDFGFRIMFWLGAAPLVLVLPLIWRYLPESAAFLAAKGRTEEAARLARRFGVPLPEQQDGCSGGGRLSALRSLASARHAVPLLLFAITSFFGLLLVYGLNTWLPEIMKSAGYPLSGSLLFLLVLNAGAIVGTILVSRLGDRIGLKPVTLAAFVSAAVSISLLSTPLPSALLYALVAVAGFGTVGTQILVNAYVATHFPAPVRATALGWTLGIGRLGAIVGPTFGGILLSAGLSVEWNFYAFAIPAVLGAGLVVLLPSRSAATEQASEERRQPAA